MHDQKYGIENRHTEYPFRIVTLVDSGERHVANCSCLHSCYIYCVSNKEVVFTTLHCCSLSKCFLSHQVLKSYCMIYSWIVPMSG